MQLRQKTPTKVLSYYTSSLMVRIPSPLIDLIALSPLIDCSSDFMSSIDQNQKAKKRKQNSKVK